MHVENGAFFHDQWWPVVRHIRIVHPSLACRPTRACVVRIRRIGSSSHSLRNNAEQFLTHCLWHPTFIEWHMLHGGDLKMRPMLWGPPTRLFSGIAIGDRHSRPAFPSLGIIRPSVRWCPWSHERALSQIRGDPANCRCSLALSDMQAQPFLQACLRCSRSSDVPQVFHTHCVFAVQEPYAALKAMRHYVRCFQASGFSLGTILAINLSNASHMADLACSLEAYPVSACSKVFQELDLLLHHSWPRLLDS